MKKLSYSFLFLIILFIFGCNQDNDIKKIIVGMTYDNVENILGKPTSITRGANELYYDIEELSYDTIRRLNLEVDTTNADTSRWLAPYKVRTVGNLIYVSWVYERTKIDTFYVNFNTYNIIEDTTKQNIPIYFLGSKKVSKTEYLKSDGYEYRLHDNSVVRKSVYEAYKKSGYYKLPTPKKIEKKIKYRTDVSINSHEVNDSIEKKYYQVVYNYCVIFDASSGRVTNKGFFPFSVREI